MKSVFNKLVYIFKYTIKYLSPKCCYVRFYFKKITRQVKLYVYLNLNIWFDDWYDNSAEYRYSYQLNRLSNELFWLAHRGGNITRFINGITY